MNWRINDGEQGVDEDSIASLVKQKPMLGHTWKAHLVAVCVNAVIYLVLSATILPIYFSFATIVGDSPIWQKIVWYILFPLHVLGWPESIMGILGFFFLNAILWGSIVQIFIRLCASKRLLI